MGTQFIETSAKTSMGVKEAFREIVEKVRSSFLVPCRPPRSASVNSLVLMSVLLVGRYQILETPELWADPKKPGQPVKKGATAAGPMPGGVSLNAPANPEERGSSCC